MPEMTNQELTDGLTALQETVQEISVRLRHTPPIGTVILLAADAEPPAGFLLCDGSAIDLSLATNQRFHDLFAVLRFTYGGDGTNVFRLPDVRGVFPRFADKGRGLDAGRSLGAQPQDWGTRMPHNPFVNQGVGDHNHTIHGVGDHSHGGFVGTVDIGNHPSGGDNRCPDGRSGMPGAGGHNHSLDAAGAHNHTLTGGDPETRPVNMAFVGYIRF